MKFFMKTVSLLLVFLFASSIVFGCSSCNSDKGKSENYTLTIWGAEEDQEMLREMCESYAKAHPENTYRFNFGVQSESELSDRVLNDVESGPDIYSFPSDQINKLYAGGALARVGGDIEQDIISKNTQKSVDAATLTINGENRLYAYPATADNCYFLYYDKGVYQNESDVDSFDTLLSKAKSANKTVHFKLNDDGWYLSSFFFSNPELKYEVTYNENMVETNVDINYNSAAGLDVMKALRTYIGNDALVAQTDDSKIISGFTDGSVAAAVSGTWNATAIKKILGDRMGVVKLPTVKIAGKDTQLSGFMGYKLIGVNGYSKNKGEAHKLAQWLTNEENQMKRFDMRGFGPTNKKLVENEKITADPVIKAVLSQERFNRAQKSVPANYWTPMGSLITPIITAKAEGKTVSDSMLMQYLDALVSQVKKKAV